MVVVQHPAPTRSRRLSGSDHGNNTNRNTSRRGSLQVTTAVVSPSAFCHSGFVCQSSTCQDTVPPGWAHRRPLTLIGAAQGKPGRKLSDIEPLPRMGSDMASSSVPPRRGRRNSDGGQMKSSANGSEPDSSVNVSANNPGRARQVLQYRSVQRVAAWAGLERANDRVATLEKGELVECVPQIALSSDRVE